MASACLLACIATCLACSKDAAEEPVADGKSIYARAGCGLCHGEKGRGDGPLVRAGSVESVDLGDPTAYRYSREVSDIATLIALGQTSGRGFMPPHAHLSESERRALAHFILELPLEAPRAPGEEEEMP